MWVSISCGSVSGLRGFNVSHVVFSVRSTCFVCHVVLVPRLRGCSVKSTWIEEKPQCIGSNCPSCEAHDSEVNLLTS